MSRQRTERYSFFEGGRKRVVTKRSLDLASPIDPTSWAYIGFNSADKMEPHNLDLVELNQVRILTRS